MRFVFFAILIFFFYRVGNFIPLPFVLVDGGFHQIDFLSQVSKTGIINQQALQRMSLFSLGIVPYITSGIVIQLIKFIFSETPYGVSLKDRKFLSSQTLVFTLAISILQSVMFSRYALGVNFDIMHAFIIVSCLVSGSFITVWFSKLITSFGYGNGASIIIMFGIVEYLFMSSSDIFSSVADGTASVSILLTQFIYFMCVIFIVCLIESAYRPLKLIYPSQRNKYGFEQGKKTDILPLKINNSGVLPLIFSMSFSSIFSIFLAPFLFEKFSIDITYVMTVINLLFMAFFVFFYTPFVLNTEDISKNLKKSSILLENRRPGDVTKQYIDSVVNKLNYIAVLYLGSMVIFPDIFKYFGLNVVISGVSCVILVSVIMDIIRRIQYSRYSEKFQKLVN